MSQTTYFCSHGHPITCHECWRVVDVTLQQERQLKAAAEARMQALEQALRMSEQFINNGVELGYIRLPDSPDPALETLPAIRAALRPAVTEQP